MTNWSLGPAPVSHVSNGENAPPGIIDFYRCLVTGERYGNRALLVILPDVTVRPPPGCCATNVQACDGRMFYAADANGRMTLRADDAAPLIGAGWKIDKISVGLLDTMLDQDRAAFCRRAIAALEREPPPIGGGSDRAPAEPLIVAGFS